MGLDIVSAETILAGDATDAYFERTEAALEWADRNPTVTAEVSADVFSSGFFEVFAGVKDLATLLSGLDIDVDALEAGRCFDGGPVARIEGPYLEFARFETAILGVLSQASAFATQALKARLSAPNSTLLSFGSRHLHPSMAAVLERSALIGGLDGFSNRAAEAFLDREASGTIPHALMICFGRGNQPAAWDAFDATAPEDISRIVLCDTYDDEVVETQLAADTLGEALDGVRLDTTGSRRGDFEHIVKEVRWELDIRGHDGVEIFCSGGIGLDDLRTLRSHVSGFGVGSLLTDAPPIDFGMDIVAVEGKPAAKRGKLSGAKNVYRTDDGGHEIRPVAKGHPDEGTALLEPLLRDGEIVRTFDIDEASNRAIRDGKAVGILDSME